MHQQSQHGMIRRYDPPNRIKYDTFGMIRIGHTKQTCRQTRSREDRPQPRQRLGNKKR